MFDIGFSELLLILVIGLLVLGPTRLPIAIRTVMGWIKVIRGMAESVQNEISHELKIQELKEDIKKVEAVNIEQFSPELSKTVRDLKDSAEKIKQDLNQNIQKQKEDWDKSIKEVDIHNFQEHQVAPSSELETAEIATNEQSLQANQPLENNHQDLKAKDGEEILPEINFNSDYYSTDDELAGMDEEQEDFVSASHPGKEIIKEKE